MPKPTASQCSTSATKKFVQEKMNSAATAPDVEHHHHTGGDPVHVVEVIGQALGRAT